MSAEIRKFFRVFLFVAFHQVVYLGFVDFRAGITPFVLAIVTHKQSSPVSGDSCVRIAKSAKSPNTYPWPAGEGEQSSRPPSFMLAKGGMVELSRIELSRFFKKFSAPVFYLPSNRINTLGFLISLIALSISDLFAPFIHLAVTSFILS